MSKDELSYSEVESMYITTNMSLEDISRKTGLSHSLLGRWAKKGKWVKMRKWYRKAISEAKIRLLKIHIEVLKEAEGGADPEMFSYLADIEKSLERRGLLPVLSGHQKCRCALHSGSEPAGTLEDSKLNSNTILLEDENGKN